MRILLTGMAGFVGYHLTQHLIGQGHALYGIDCLSDYYSVVLKTDRLAQLGFYPDRLGRHTRKHSASALWPDLYFEPIAIQDTADLAQAFDRFKPDVVVHLAAQAGLRYVKSNPQKYIVDNVLASAALFDIALAHGVSHIMFASSSSVYGFETRMPLREDMPCDKPSSMYGASKRAAELTAFCYSNQHNVKITALRFFSVYGSWGRPDMVVSIFADALLNNKIIELREGGRMWRDFTHIADICTAIDKLMRSEQPRQRFEIVNIGRGEPARLTDLLAMLEAKLTKQAQVVSMPKLDAEMVMNHADVSKLKQLTGWQPHVNLNEGLDEFVSWFIEYRALRERV